MSRISSWSLLAVGLALAACDVQVHPPVVIEEKRKVVVEKPAPIEIHVDDKK
jgi:hypothetical protein